MIERSATQTTHTPAAIEQAQTDYPQPRLVMSWAVDPQTGELTASWSTPRPEGEIIELRAAA